MKITGQPGRDRECRITEPTAEAAALTKTLGSKARIERDGTIVADMKIRYKFSDLLNPKPAAVPAARRTWTDADEARLQAAERRYSENPLAPFASEDVIALRGDKRFVTDTTPVPPAPTEAFLQNVEHVLSEEYDR